jgi:hypothetical protein
VLNPSSCGTVLCSPIDQLRYIFQDCLHNAPRRLCNAFQHTCKTLVACNQAPSFSQYADKMCPQIATCFDDQFAHYQACGLVPMSQIEISEVSLFSFSFKPDPLDTSRIALLSNDDMENEIRKQYVMYFFRSWLRSALKNTLFAKCTPQQSAFFLLDFIVHLFTKYACLSSPPPPSSLWPPIQARNRLSCVIQRKVNMASGV